MSKMFALHADQEVKKVSFDKRSDHVAVPADERFNHGRVLLAGDAAHQVSSFGASGANSGNLDAAPSALLNARLILLLANRVRDLNVLREALALAREGVTHHRA